MKTAIGFDSWTGGSSHFIRLIPALKARGLELRLLHLGSWGSDPGRLQQEEISGMAVCDISLFGSKSFLNIIDEIRPAMVIFLSVDTFSHRAFNRYCKLRGIPTLYLYCGLMRVQAVEDNKPLRVNFISQSRFVLIRVNKFFSKVFPSYMSAMIATGAQFLEWRRFMGDVYNFIRGIRPPVSALDSRTDKCAVYTQAEIQHAVKKYGFGEQDVTAVGNPDLITFRLKREAMGYGLSRMNESQPDILYIDTGLVYASSIFNNADEFREHLLLTKRSLEQQGLRLAIKLHPLHYTTDFPDRLVEMGVSLVSNEEFVRRLKTCPAAITEPSTAGLIPALLGIPVLMAAYGKLSGQKYGEVLTSYPRAIRLQEVGEVAQLIRAELGTCNRIRVTKWINENAGPLPAEDMAERVAIIVDEMIAEAANRRTEAY